MRRHMKKPGPVRRAFNKLWSSVRGRKDAQVQPLHPVSRLHPRAVWMAVTGEHLVLHPMKKNTKLLRMIVAHATYIQPCGLSVQQRGTPAGKPEEATVKSQADSQSTSLCPPKHKTLVDSSPTSAEIPARFGQATTSLSPSGADMAMASDSSFTTAGSSFTSDTCSYVSCWSTQDVTEEDKVLSEDEQPVDTYMQPLESADPHPNYACISPQLSTAASHVAAPVIAAAEAEDTDDTLPACPSAFNMADKRSLADGPATSTSNLKRRLLSWIRPLFGCFSPASKMPVQQSEEPLCSPESFRALHSCKRREECMEIQRLVPIHWLHPRAIMVALLYNSLVPYKHTPRRLLDVLVYQKSLIRYADPHPGMVGWRNMTGFSKYLLDPELLERDCRASQKRMTSSARTSGAPSSATYAAQELVGGGCPDIVSAPLELDVDYALIKDAAEMATTYISDSTMFGLSTLTEEEPHVAASAAAKLEDPRRMLLTW